MKTITLRGTTEVDVEVSQRVINILIKGQLLQLINLPESSYRGYFFDDLSGLVRCWEEFGGHCSTIEHSDVREATKLDKAVFTVLRQLEQNEKL